MLVRVSCAFSLSLRRCYRMSLQSALIGFLLSRVLASSVTAQENVVIQTTAVATGTMALAAGFVGIIPALGLLNVAQDGIPPIHLSWTAALAWSFAVAYYGSVLVPHSLRLYLSTYIQDPHVPAYQKTSRMCPDQSSSSKTNPGQIIKEKLAFPSGTATAQLIAVLHKLPPPTEPNANPQDYTPLNTDEEHPGDHSTTPGESPDQASSHLSQSLGSLTWSLMLSALITVCDALSTFLDSVD